MENKWTIKDVRGLHLRPASQLCTAAMEYECEITLRFRNGKYNAKSLLSVLSACVQSGDEIEMDFEGPDAEAAQQRISQLLNEL